MRTKALFLFFAFGLFFISFESCSNTDLADIPSAPKTEVTEKLSSEFISSLSTAIEQAVSTPIYVVYDGVTKESLICNEEQFFLGKILYTILNTGNKSKIQKTIKTKANRGEWIFAGHVKIKFQIFKLAKKLSSKLPSDKTIEIRIVPRKDGGKDVYYRIV